MEVGFHGVDEGQRGPAYQLFLAFLVLVEPGFIVMPGKLLKKQQALLRITGEGTHY